MNWIAPNKYVEDGYGNSTHDLKTALEKQGVVFDGTGHTIVYGTPERAPEANYGVYTMWETEQPPMEWKPYLEKADWVANPTKWGCKVFEKAYGIKVHHVPLAYADDFQYIERPERDTFTFLAYNSGFSAIRKGFLEILNAWKISFGNNKEVKLIIKDARPDIFKKNKDWWKEIKTDNIEYIAESYTRPELIKLLGKADMFVFPSRGEGWGHTPLEAMATGLNCIIPNKHGISEYFNPYLNLSYTTQNKQAYFDRPGDFGTWPVAITESLALAMMNAYVNKDTMREDGKECAEYVKQWNYERTAKELLALI